MNRRSRSSSVTAAFLSPLWPHCRRACSLLAIPLLAISVTGCGGSSVESRIQAELPEGKAVRSCEPTGRVVAGAKVYSCGVGAAVEEGPLQEETEAAFDSVGLEEMCFAVQGERVEFLSSCEGL